MPTQIRSLRLNPTIKNLTLALLSVMATTLMRLALTPLLGRRAILIIYFPALVFSAWIGGWPGGIVCLVLSMLVATYFFLSPDHTLAVPGHSDQVTLAIFTIVGLSVSALSDSQRRAHKRAEAAYEREALVNRIGQSVRSASDPQLILKTAVEELGRTLGADRCYYVTYDLNADEGRIIQDWYREGLKSVVGTYRMSDFGYNRDAGYKLGATHVVEDVLAEPDAPGARVSAHLGLRSLVRAPLHQGSFMTALAVAMASAGRKWSGDEIALVETVAAQTKAAVEAAQVTERERTFLRDVLASVTEGKLLLVNNPEQLPLPLTPVGEPIPLSRDGGLSDLRHLAREAAQLASHPEDRQHDLMTAASEAGMNTIVHGGGGVGFVSIDGNGTVQVRVEDHGAGISIENLPRATLARGFSTKATLGHGMKMILETADRLYLLTGTTGTTVVLEQGREKQLPAWF